MVEQLFESVAEPDSSSDEAPKKSKDKKRKKKSASSDSATGASSSSSGSSDAKASQCAIVVCFFPVGPGIIPFKLQDHDMV